MEPALRRTILLLVAFSAACATLPVTPVEHADFRDLGTVDGEGLDRAVSAVLVEGRGFSLERSSLQFASLYYETDWKERDPFEAEAARGIIDARSRVLIRGRRTSDGRFRSTLEAESQVRTDSTPSWHSEPVGPGFRAWVDSIVAGMDDAMGSG